MLGSDLDVAVAGSEQRVVFSGIGVFVLSTVCGIAWFVAKWVKRQRAQRNSVTQVVAASIESRPTTETVADVGARVFVRDSVEKIVSICKGRTSLQAEALIETMYRGKWMEFDLPVDNIKAQESNWIQVALSRRGPKYFKRAWFKVPATLDADATARVRAWAVDGDWTVGVLMGRSRTGSYVIEDLQQVRARPAERDALILRTATTDGYRVRVMLPQDPGAAGVAQRDAHAKLLAGFNVRFVRPTGSKVTRAQPLSAQAEAGNVALAVGAWREPFLQCLEGLPDAP